MLDLGSLRVLKQPHAAETLLLLFYPNVIPSSSRRPRHPLLDHVNNALKPTQPLLLVVAQEQLDDRPSVDPPSLFVADNVRACVPEQSNQISCLRSEHFLGAMDEEPAVRGRSLPPPGQVLIMAR